jgi:hypothetical protein
VKADMLAPPKEPPKMNNLLTTLTAFLALGAGTAVAIFDSAPLITDALTGAGLGGFVGGVIAYRRERIASDQRRETPVKANWIVLRWSCVGAGAAALVHLFAAVL